MPDSVISALASHGIIGLFCGLFIWLYLKERADRQADRVAYDAALKAERDARIADQSKYAEKTLEMTKDVISAVDKSSETVDKLIEMKRQSGT